MADELNQFRNYIIGEVHKEVALQLRAEQSAKEFAAKLNQLTELIQRSKNHFDDELEQQIEYCKQEAVAIAGGTYIRQSLDDYHNRLLHANDEAANYNQQSGVGWLIVLVILGMLLSGKCTSQAQNNDYNPLKSLTDLSNQFKGNNQQPNISLPTEIPLK